METGGRGGLIWTGRETGGGAGVVRRWGTLSGQLASQTGAAVRTVLISTSPPGSWGWTTTVAAPTPPSARLSNRNQLQEVYLIFSALLKYKMIFTIQF